MIAPMLSGVVYLYTVKAMIEVCKDWNIHRLYLHSFIAEMPESFRGSDAKADVHVLAGLTSFANACKLAVYGEPGDKGLAVTAVTNQRRLIRTVNREWEDKPGDRVRVLHGMVSDYVPPAQALIPIENALKSKPPDDLFPVLTLTKTDLPRS